MWQSQPCCQFYPSGKPQHRSTKSPVVQKPFPLQKADVCMEVCWCVCRVSACHLNNSALSWNTVSSSLPGSRLENGKQLRLTTVPTIQHCQYLPLHFKTVLWSLFLIQHLLPFPFPPACSWIRMILCLSLWILGCPWITVAVGKAPLTGIEIQIFD